MPPEEIRAVLSPGDPVIARRLLDLHRERLGEWIEEQRRVLASVERAIGGQPVGRAPRRATCVSAATSSARR
jgi:hypothetical protein